VSLRGMLAFDGKMLIQEVLDKALGSLTAQAVRSNDLSSIRAIRAHKSAATDLQLMHRLRSRRAWR
jgi:hypothetical protein